MIVDALLRDQREIPMEYDIYFGIYQNSWSDGLISMSRTPRQGVTIDSPAPLECQG